MITRNRRERANAAKVRIGVKGKEEHEAIAEALQEWQGSRFQMCQRHLLRRQRRGQCTLSLWKCPQSQAVWRMLKATPEWLTQQLDDSDNEKWDKAYTVCPHHQLDEEVIHAQASEISALVQIEHDDSRAKRDPRARSQSVMFVVQTMKDSDAVCVNANSGYCARSERLSSRNMLASLLVSDSPLPVGMQVLEFCPLATSSPLAEGWYRWRHV
ncbi:hypothetical protein PC121_g21528 [Phytophthora cactorum]|nr:hypothetical protein PC121_g21528 [Phytophthora cactorum]KAG3130219.1 hypothetical protein C6341_g23833 [Phytophthora cactorum]